jgi:hypothetical protein
MSSFLVSSITRTCSLIPETGSSLRNVIFFGFVHYWDMWFDTWNWQLPLECHLSLYRPSLGCASLSAPLATTERGRYVTRNLVLFSPQFVIFK